MKIKLNCKEKIGMACVVGVVALAIMIPTMCCHPKCPEKRFLNGGREMLGAIPDIAKKCTSQMAKKILP